MFVELSRLTAEAPGWGRRQARRVAYAVAYTGPQRDSAAVCSVQMVRSEAET
jgi:hypothetical protein